MRLNVLQFTVIAFDDRIPRCRASAQVTVIIDEDVAPPYCQSNQQTTIPDTTPVNLTQVYRFQATDNNLRVSLYFIAPLVCDGKFLAGLQFKACHSGWKLPLLTQ